MAFGLFRKKEKADLVLMNGLIYTGDRDNMWAEAVASSDGIIIAAGSSDAVGEFIGDETEVVDLKNRTVTPGFIELCGNPVNRAFYSDAELLTENESLEDILEHVKEMTEDEEKSAYFAFGFDKCILNDAEDGEKSSILDRACPERPVILLSSDGRMVWMNTCAGNILKGALEEEGLKRVTFSYIAEIFDIIDFEETGSRIDEIAERYCELGVTSIVNRKSPDYLDEVYQDILLEKYSEGEMKQRYFGNLYLSGIYDENMTVRTLRRKKTKFNEIETGFEFDTLHIGLKPEGKCINEDNEKELDDLVISASDAGFNIHYSVYGEEEALMALRASEKARSAGYRNNIFSIESETPLNGSIFKDTLLGEEVIETMHFEECYDDDIKLSVTECINPAKRSMEELIDMLTIDAAVALGREDELGTIEPGKKADLTVFDENPFEKNNVAGFRKLRAVMTVVDGKIVYDVDRENDEEWYQMMSGMYI